MNKECWLIFRGKMVTDPNMLSDPDSMNIEELDEVIEIVKGEMVSKTYMKLKDSPLFHPNVSYGDIMKVKPCEEALSERVTILEFNGIEHDEFNEHDETDDASDEVLDIGSETPQLSSSFLGMMKGFDSKIRPMINDKFEQGLVFEPVKFISHGSYKINVAYEANGDNYIKMKDYFKDNDVHFQASSAKNLGSVAFNTETKFKKAVECLESAPWIKQCYLAFAPDEFPEIEFSSDLIPKKDE